MKVIVNNIEQIVQEDASLLDLLQQLEMSQRKGIAIAINNMVVAKTDWETKSIIENDRITIISATQGG